VGVSGGDGRGDGAGDFALAGYILCGCEATDLLFRVFGLWLVALGEAPWGAERIAHLHAHLADPIGLVGDSGVGHARLGLVASEPYRCCDALSGYLHRFVQHGCPDFTGAEATGELDGLGAGKRRGNVDLLGGGSALHGIFVWGVFVDGNFRMGHMVSSYAKSVWGIE